jgi:hypothetical protein
MFHRFGKLAGVLFALWLARAGGFRDFGQRLLHNGYGAEQDALRQKLDLNVVTNLQLNLCRISTGKVICAARLIC